MSYTRSSISSVCHERRDRALISFFIRDVPVVTARIGAQLDDLAQVGVQWVMLQWLDLDDSDGLEALATTVVAKL